MKNNWYKKPEMIVALSALLISVITVIIGVYSAYIDRAYSRASVWPRLEIFRSYSANSLEYGVTNNGTGPAVIKYVKIQREGKSIKRWSDIPGLPIFTQSHVGNRILPSEATVKPISIKNDKIATLIDIFSNTSISICYCSIYEECWLTDKNNQPQPIAACIIDEKDSFLQ